MGKKEFNISAQINIDVDVEADTEEEAKKKALETFLFEYAVKEQLTAVEIEYLQTKLNELKTKQDGRNTNSNTEKPRVNNAIFKNREKLRMSLVKT